jgi:hypothetical protein
MRRSHVVVAYLRAVPRIIYSEILDMIIEGHVACRNPICTEPGFLLLQQQDHHNYLSKLKRLVSTVGFEPTLKRA